MQIRNDRAYIVNDEDAIRRVQKTKNLEFVKIGNVRPPHIRCPMLPSLAWWLVS